MKAILLKAQGDPQQLSYEEVSKPEPGPQDVVVRLKAAALNRRDVHMTYGRYPAVLPVIPGSDGAGVIASCGRLVTNVAEGDEVIINPGLDWGNDVARKGPDFNILGGPTDGTYAQYVKVPAENVHAKPAHLSWEEAAALPLGGLTAYRALVTKGQIQAGQTVFVPGVGGGVATMLVQFAAAHGARVYVSSSQDYKLEKAIKLGVAGGVNYTADEWAEELQRMSGGIDLIVDSIGGDAFNTFISLGKIGSRIVSFGATNGSIANIKMPTIFAKEITILGTNMGSPSEFRQMVEFVEKHKIRPVIDKTYPLESAAEAQSYMEKGLNFGKIVLSIPPKGVRK